MTECQIENQGKVHQCIIPRSSYMKFYPIWSRCCGEMALDGRTDGQVEGRMARLTNRQTDEAATICSPFWEHNKWNTSNNDGQKIAKRTAI